MNLLTQVRPQMVGQTFFTLLTVTSVVAAGGIQGLIDGIDNFRNVDLACIPAQAIATAGPRTLTTRFWRRRREKSCSR